ncbi:MAG: DUF1343 domain-containing protein [Bacteroidales bacterium]|nr:DUF1343 domain-containing protein [Bacteroidales bacterium]
MKFFLYIFIISLFFGCHAKPNTAQTVVTKADTIIKPEIKKLIVAAEDTANYLNLLREKKVALVANQTSIAFDKHLLDFLIENGITVEKIFAPEHGFRGAGEPGQRIYNETDEKTGVKIVSLFGNNKKPTAEHLKGIETVVYDIQDVGCRFFTYISTLHYIMESCAENNVKIIVLDRPNPNIDYVDGPVREENCKSFVSLDPLPIVYGMTVGELAQMINGEGWLSGDKKCDLTVVPVKNYTRKTKYELPVRPSPNLPDYLSIRLYPSLCLFEGTNISVGRGTLTPFTSIGYPEEKYGEYVFTPKDITGMQTNPMHKGKKCYGLDFKGLNPNQQHFTLEYFIKMYKIAGEKMLTRKKMLALLYGNTKLPQQLSEDMTEDEIRKTWQPQLSDFKQKRQKYLIYE